MSFSKISSMQNYLLESHIVDVEVDISRGLNSFSIVGLPDKAVAEAKERISAAIKNSNFESPKSRNHRLTISLAPATLRKEGSHFDLAMALAYLISLDEIHFDSENKIFLGELSLDSSIRPIKGAFIHVLNAKKKGFKEIFLPYQNKEEVEMISGIDIILVSTLQETIDHLTLKKVLAPLVYTDILKAAKKPEVDIADIRGQESAKRALQIAATGGHNILLYGPPGTGKTMLAKAFASILPDLSFEEMLEVTSVYSSMGHRVFISSPPFRSPHHSATQVSIIGGGAYPKPGEVTLAHRGVLFLDEFGEFDSKIIDSLRQPIEDKLVHISRAKTSAVFPCSFVLVAAMNPCPCGFLGSRVKECQCSTSVIRSYRQKISGPIADRIDMWVEVGHIPYEQLATKNNEESSVVIKNKVSVARAFLRENESQELSPRCQSLLEESSKKLHQSPRMYYRIKKLARTIASVDMKKNIEERHILEALQYRPRMD